MTPLIKVTLGALAAAVLAVGFLFWQNGGLREKVGATEQACETAMEALAAEHVRKIAEAREEVRSQQAERVAELREALRQERNRRIDLLRRNEELEVGFQNVLDSLNSPEEEEWKAQRLPDSLLWLDSQPSP